MAIKGTVAILTTATSLAMMNTSCEDNKQDISKKELIEVLDTKSESWTWENDDAVALLSSTTSEKNKKNVKENKENFNEDCFSVSLQDLEGTPFLWSKRMIAPSYWNLLGYSQAEDIIKTYNGLHTANFNASDWVDQKDTLSIPLIYPELKAYFPEDLDSLMKNFSEYANETANDLIIVSQCDNWKNALAYYKNWKLRLATYVSIWTARRKTVSWAFELTHDRIRRRSRRYHNSAMPYSIWITWWYYLHQWWSNWKPQSHGCVRVPWLYEKWLYENLPANTKIILSGLYTPTLIKH